MVYFRLFWKGRQAFLALSRELGGPFWAYWGTFLSGQGSIQRDQSPILSLLGPILDLFRWLGGLLGPILGAHFRSLSKGSWEPFLAYFGRVGGLLGSIQGARGAILGLSGPILRRMESKAQFGPIGDHFGNIQVARGHIGAI